MMWFVNEVFYKTRKGMQNDFILTFSAEGLKLAMVTSYKEIEIKLNEGTTNRSIASTNMNATSR